MEKGLGYCGGHNSIWDFAALRIRLAGSPRATSHFQLATISNIKQTQEMTSQDKSTRSQTAGDTVPISVTQYESRSAVTHSGPSNVSQRQLNKMNGKKNSTCSSSLLLGRNGRTAALLLRIQQRCDIEGTKFSLFEYHTARPRARELKGVHARRTPNDFYVRSPGTE